MRTPETQAHNNPAPSLSLMHMAFVLAGLGTMLLGPILPVLAKQWHLQDSQSGLLVLAQFCGSTLGGSSTSHRLRGGLMVGFACATAGFLGFAFAAGLLTACASLAVAGFGVGRVITAVNILAGARYTQHRASALSWLNFSWSFGALLSPLSAASLVQRFTLQHLLLGFSALFLLVTLLYAVQLRRDPVAAETSRAQPDLAVGLPMQLFLYFAALLLLYGGLETCLSAWLTTYALRYGKASLVLSEYTMVLFLCGLTSGRAVAAMLLRVIRDRTLLRIGLLCSAALAAALAAAHTAGWIVIFAILLGVSLAPIFPATFAIVLGEQPRARQAGLILAASGVGAAVLPLMMGVVSTHTGSLQIALSLPVAAAVAMFLLTLFAPGSLSTTPQVRRKAS